MFEAKFPSQKRYNLVEYPSKHKCGKSTSLKYDKMNYS